MVVGQLNVVIVVLHKFMYIIKWHSTTHITCNKLAMSSKQISKIKKNLHFLGSSTVAQWVNSLA